GEVIAQSYTPEPYGITLAAENDFKAFYEKEMTMRRTFKYAPYVFLALITITDENFDKVIDVANSFDEKLEMVLFSEAIILGPTPSHLERIKKRYRYQIIIKYRFEKQLQHKISVVKNEFSKELKKDLQILIDINPHQLM